MSPQEKKKMGEGAEAVLWLMREHVRCVFGARLERERRHFRDQVFMISTPTLHLLPSAEKGVVLGQKQQTCYLNKARGYYFSKSHQTSPDDRAIFAALPRKGVYR